MHKTYDTFFILNIRYRYGYIDIIGINIDIDIIDIDIDIFEWGNKNFIAFLLVEKNKRKQKTGQLASTI